MVMHARKCPKLSDGYYGRNESRPYENMDKYPSSKSSRGYRSDRYYDESPSSNHNSYHDDDDSSSPSDRYSSPRYSNKSSYMEKTRTKYNDRGTSRSPGDKRSDYNKSNHYHRNGPIRNSRESRDSRERDYRNSRDRDAYRSDRDPYSRDRDRDPNNRDSRDARESNQSRLGGGYKNAREGPIRDGVGESATKKDGPIKRSLETRDNHVVKDTAKKDVRAEVQKTALRVCGDWSEHKSSSGKTFYYHCRQNISKWEKPKDWNDDDCIIPEHIKKQQAAKAAAERRQTSTSAATQRTNNFHGIGAKNARTDNENNKNNSNASKTPNGSYGNKTPSYHGNTPGSRVSTPGNRGQTPSSAASCSAQTYGGRDDVTSGGHIAKTNMASTIRTTSNASMRRTSSADCSQTAGSASGATIESSAQNGRFEDSNSRLSSQALQTLQKLQQALTRQAELENNVNSHSPVSAGTPSPHTSPNRRRRTTSDATNQSQVEDMECGNSPHSDTSFRSSRCSSPAPSPASSTEGAGPVGVCGLSSNQQAQTTDLTPSLANYYDDQLTHHVRGWPADHFARQADHFMYEAHTVGGLHCTQVSADLKKARSLVRIAEIQSTLQEQRILFLIQQVKDLENAKGQSSYLPT